MIKKSAYARCDKCNQYLDRCECELIELRERIKSMENAGKGAAIGAAKIANHSCEQMAEKDKRIAMLREALEESCCVECATAGEHDCADVRINKAIQATAADVEEWFEKVKAGEREKIYAQIDREETESIAYCIGSKAGHFVEGGRCQTCKKDWIPKSRISSTTEKSSDA